MSAGLETDSVLVGGNQETPPLRDDLPHGESAVGMHPPLVLRRGESDGSTPLVSPDSQSDPEKSNREEAGSDSEVREESTQLVPSDLQGVRPEPSSDSEPGTEIGVQEIVATVHPWAREGATGKELERYKLTDRQQDAVVALTLPGKFRKTDEDVADAIGVSTATIANWRRNENFALAMKRSAAAVALSYAPEVLGRLTDMAKEGDKYSMRLYLEKVPDLLVDNDRAESRFGESIRKMGAEFDSIYISAKKYKPGHHRPPAQ